MSKQTKATAGLAPAHLEAIKRLAAEVVAEVVSAESKHRPYAGAHEGWAVIFEELDELWEHVRGDTGRSDAARKEAIQIAATGIRYALNVCDGVAE